MLTLLRNAEVFSPQRLGRSDVLIAGGKVCRVEPVIDVAGPAIEIVDASGLWLLPGLVDPLTHPCGGGGEGGFGNRTPEMAAAEFISAGVTTPIGALGTDAITRSLDVLYGKVMELRAAGVSAFMLNGSYRIPPATLTGDVARDLVLVEPVIGTGEVAISDHRSVQPDADELRRLAAIIHLGGTLSGKRGTLLLHVGDGEQGLALMRQALQGSELPARLFYPTHVNRNHDLLEQAVAFTRSGGFADITVSTTPEFIEEGEVPALTALQDAIAAGAPASRLTLSSDAGGSLPLYRAGELDGLDVARPSALVDALCDTVRTQSERVETVLAAMTSNPADAYGLAAKGRVKPGGDADLLLFDPDGGQLVEVYGMGRPLLRRSNAEESDQICTQGAQ